MALIDPVTNTKPKVDRETLRVYPVTAKLTKSERKAITDFARTLGSARGQWIREVILRELTSSPRPDVSLAEVLGVRLLLVNVLRPLASGQKLSPEAFDKLLDDISRVKHELAGKLLAERK
jgi:hypothetical protein